MIEKSTCKLLCVICCSKTLYSILNIIFMLLEFAVIRKNYVSILEIYMCVGVCVYRGIYILYIYIIYNYFLLSNTVSSLILNRVLWLLGTVFSIPFNILNVFYFISSLKPHSYFFNSFLLVVEQYYLDHHVCIRWMNLVRHVEVVRWGRSKCVKWMSWLSSTTWFIPHCYVYHYCTCICNCVPL